MKIDQEYRSRDSKLIRSYAIDGVGLIVMFRVLAPRPSVNYPSCAFGADTSPLFEEKGNARRDTGISHSPYPDRIYWSRLRSAFASDDYPVDSGEWHAKRREQRLEGDETDSCWNVAKVMYTEKVIWTFDRDAHPYIGIPGQRIGELAKPL